MDVLEGRAFKDRAFSVKSGTSKLHPESQSASGERFQIPERQNRIRKLKIVPGRVLRRVKMVSGRVESVPVNVQIASGGRKLRPDGKLQNHWFSHGFPVVSRFWPFSEGRGRLRRVKVVSLRGRFVEGSFR